MELVGAVNLSGAVTYPHKGVGAVDGSFTIYPDRVVLYWTDGAGQVITHTLRLHPDGLAFKDEPITHISPVRLPNSERISGLYQVTDESKA